MGRSPPLRIGSLIVRSPFKMQGGIDWLKGRGKIKTGKLFGGPVYLVGVVEASSDCTSL